MSKNSGIFGHDHMYQQSISCVADKRANTWHSPFCDICPRLGQISQDWDIPINVSFCPGAIKDMFRFSQTGSDRLGKLEQIILIYRIRVTGNFCSEIPEFLDRKSLFYF